MKMKVLDEKHLLRRVATGLVPASIQRRRKQPYRAPDGKSFVTEKWGYVEDLLSSESVRKAGIFNPQSVAALFTKFKNGRVISTRDNMALVGILSTQMLNEMFVDCQSVPALGQESTRHRIAGNTYAPPQRTLPWGYA